MNYFSQWDGNQIDGCACDVCSEDYTMEDISEKAYMLLRAVDDCRGVYGETTVVSLLRGKLQEKHKSLRTCASFGIGKHVDAREWKAIVSACCDEKVVETKIWRTT